MGAENMLSTSTLLGFLLTLVRVSGVFAFVPKCLRAKSWLQNAERG